MATTAGFKRDDHVILTMRGVEYGAVVVGETRSGYVKVEVLIHGEPFTINATSAELRFQELVA